jgi:hypothetical protein
MKTHSEHIEEDYCAATKVVAKLGLLPLAISQAGAFISQRQISFQRYLSILGEGLEASMARAPEWPWGQQAESILTTWEISFASLSRPAKELLLLCGFLSNEDIPEELFNLDSEARFDWMGEGKTISSVYWLLVLTLNRRWLAHGRARSDLLAFLSKAESLR